MANVQNLRPQKHTLTSEESRKGGIRSGEVRREKATMKKTLEMLLNETNKDGIPYRDLATLGLIKGAVKGNAQNYKTIVEVLGEIQSDTETPTLKIQVIENDYIKENKDE